MTQASIRERLLDEMRTRFGVAPVDVRFVWSPYRICPLGAHIDHQLGTVTAMAIDRGTLLAYAPSGSAEVRLGSLRFQGEVRFDIGRIPPPHPGDWGNYARGAAAALVKSVGLREGMIGMTNGELMDVGLSSSASIGLAYLLALEDVNGLKVSTADNIRLDHGIENGYLGLNNGILDQSAILISQRDQLTVIDCKAFEAGAPGAGDRSALPPGVTRVPRHPALPPYAILIAFSGLTKSIISTDYNRHVAECSEAARDLLEAAGRPGVHPRLAHVTPEEYFVHRARLSGTPAKRAEHFFSEMDRVRRGIEAWRTGDLANLGRLIRESGRSSIVNYECGCPPMIDLYEILIGTPSVYGARFSGAGFRGCCVALAEPEAAARALPEIRRAYAAKHPEFAATAQFFLCGSDDGARIL